MGPPAPKVEHAMAREHEAHGDSDVTFNAWVQLALGHQSLEESLSYSSVKLKGCGAAGRLGRFTTESEGVETGSASGHSGDSSEDDW